MYEIRKLELPTTLKMIFIYIINSTSTYKYRKRGTERLILRIWNELMYSVDASSAAVNGAK
jgi:hypothetical protein